MSGSGAAGAARDVLATPGLARCFEGAVPAVVATASGDGTPNVTYLSRVRRVDDERVALSNQFFSKTARNLAENPRASLLLIDPLTYDEYRLELVYERTERRGPVFEQLRTDVDLIASMSGMQGVFRLRAADIYRVVAVDLLANAGLPVPAPTPAHRSDLDAVAELVGCLARCGDLDALVATTVAGLDRVLGHRHVVLFLLDEDGQRLVTLASHGYPSQGVGSEVAVGDGVAGAAAQRVETVRIGNLRQVEKYTASVRGAHDGAGIELPDLGGAQSRLAVPAVAAGQLVGVLMVESDRPAAFTAADEAALAVVAAVVAHAVEADRASGDDAPTAPSDTAATDADRASTAPRGPAAEQVPEGAATVRFFAEDGSTFVDGEYLIKGVAGRILWSLLRQHAEDGRVDFTNREVRLDRSLDLPPYRDNLESRLLLLKRRLDERSAPVRIERTGRGRFRLRVDRRVDLQLGGA